jgi:hypothetical protein
MQAFFKTTIIFCALSSIYFNKLGSSVAAESLRIEEHPEGLICAIHVQYYSTDPATASILDDLLFQNKAKWIWSIYASESRYMITPHFAFHEQCAVSIFIDGKVPNRAYNAISTVGFENNLREYHYASRSWRFSAFIVVVQNCDITDFEISESLPFRLFYHLMGCGLDHQPFPNFAYLPTHGYRHRPFFIYSKLYPSFSIHERALRKEWRQMIPPYHVGWNKPYIPFPVGLLPLASLPHDKYCDLSNYMMHHYMKYLNFTTFTMNRAAFFNPTYTGVSMILTNEEYDYTPHLSIGTKAYDYGNALILYCDPYASGQSGGTNTLSLLSLFSPFNFECWIWLGVLLMGLLATNKLCSFMQEGIVYIKVDLLVKQRPRFLPKFDMIRSAFEQDDRIVHWSALPLIFSLFLLNTLYKNDIAAKLIVKDEPNTLQSLSELFDAGYKLVVAVYTSNTSLNELEFSFTKHKLMFSLPSYTREKLLNDSELWEWMPLVGLKKSDVAKAISDRDSKIGMYIEMRTSSYEVMIIRANLLSYPRKCHHFSLTGSLGQEPFFQNFLTPLAENLLELTSKFIDHGLISYWSTLEETFQIDKERMLNLTKLQTKSNQIYVSVKNLAPLGIVCGIFISIALLQFIMELRRKCLTKLFLAATFVSNIYLLSCLWMLNLLYKVHSRLILILPTMTENIAGYLTFIGKHMCRILVMAVGYICFKLGLAYGSSGVCLN